MAHRVAAIAEQTDLPTPVPPNRRAVFVTGVRTPFTRGYAEQLNATVVDLGVAAVAGLLTKIKMDGNDIDHLVWGGAVPMPFASNTAREVIIDLKLPPTISAHTEAMACASGMKAIVSAVQMIESGNANAVIAGGSDSMSTARLAFSQEVTTGLALLSAGKLSSTELLKKVGMPWSWMPTKPEIAERSTGKTMGYHADVMAQLCGVQRHASDAFAMDSHRKAASASKAGIFADEIVPVRCRAGPFSSERSVTKDTLIRETQNPAKMATLKTAFRPREQGGTVTAASASPITDGGAACLVLSAAEAHRRGYAADVALRSWATSGIAPTPNLLLAPARAIPVALRRAGLQLSDIDYFEFHEAFAGQVLATINVLESQDLSQRYLESPALGKIPLDRVNVYGSSVSIGHPFGATGVRLATNAARILRNKKEAKYILVSICAAGGLGMVTIFERV